MKSLYLSVFTFLLWSTAFAQNQICPSAFAIHDEWPDISSAPHISDVEYLVESLEPGQSNGPFTPAPLTTGGCIDLDALPTVASGGSYRIYPVKNKDHLNGVSTLDLVLTIRHLINIQALEGYQLLAADVDNSSSINTLDIATMQQVILHIIDEFPINSWQFVDAAVDPIADPTGIHKDFIEIDPENAPDDLYFWGVKTGDINGSSVPLVSGTEDLVFEVEDQVLLPGETITVDFKARDFKELLAYQYTLEFDESVLEFVSHDYKALPSSEDKIFAGENTSLTEEGFFPNFWVNLESDFTIDDGAVLFSLTFKVLEKELLSNVLQASSEATENYVFNNFIDEPSNVVLNFDFSTEINPVNAQGFKLGQNQPNPVKTSTTIPFLLEEAGSYHLNIIDPLGRVIKTVEGQGSAGAQNIQLRRSDFGAAGLYHYTLQSNGNSASKRLIIY